MSNRDAKSECALIWWKVIELAQVVSEPTDLCLKHRGEA
jgi:hypothetical protein